MVDTALYLSILGLPGGCLLSALVPRGVESRYLRAFAVASPVLALFLGIVAVGRIRRSNSGLLGIEDAYIAIVISLLWLLAYGCLLGILVNIYP